MTALTVEIRGGLLRDLLRIAKREGIPAPMLVVDACALLVQTCPASATAAELSAGELQNIERVTDPRTRGLVDPSSERGQQIVRNAAFMRPTTQGDPPPAGLAPAPPVAKRGPGRPRKVRPDPDARCVVCEHTRGEHCGEHGKCLSARCVCREFAA